MEATDTVLCSLEVNKITSEQISQAPNLTSEYAHDQKFTMRIVVHKKGSI